MRNAAKRTRPPPTKGGKVNTDNADGCKRIQTDANNADTENNTDTDTDTENGTETAPGKGVRGETRFR